MEVCLNFEFGFGFGFGFGFASCRFLFDLAIVGRAYLYTHTGRGNEYGIAMER